jgi:hypothetical protein
MKLYIIFQETQKILFNAVFLGRQSKQSFFVYGRKSEEENNELGGSRYMFCVLGKFSWG